MCEVRDGLVLVRAKFRKLEGWSFGEPVLGYGEGSEIKQK